MSAWATRAAMSVRPAPVCLAEEHASKGRAPLAPKVLCKTLRPVGWLMCVPRPAKAVGI